MVMGDHPPRPFQCRYQNGCLTNFSADKENNMKDQATSKAIGTVHRLWLNYNNLPKPRAERFGQYVCNRVSITCPDLFYETDDEKAFTTACLVVSEYISE